MRFKIFSVTEEPKRVFCADCKHYRPHVTKAFMQDECAASQYIASPAMVNYITGEAYPAVKLLRKCHQKNSDGLCKSFEARAEVRDAA